jgi:cobaltochelatase CobT
MRSIAGDSGLAIGFGADGYGANSAVSDGHVWINDLPLLPDCVDLTVVRGQADTVAFWRAHHDVAVHERISPRDARRRAFLELLEQVRVDVLGARRLPGARVNIVTMLETRYLTPRFAGAMDRFGSPADEALALWVRHAFWPAWRAYRFLDVWHPVFEGELSAGRQALVAAVDDQDRFARIALGMIADLGRFLALDSLADPVKAFNLKSDETPGPIEGDRQSDGAAEGMMVSSADMPAKSGSPGEVQRAEGSDAGGELHDSSDSEPTASRAVDSIVDVASERLDYRMYTRRFDRTVYPEKELEPQQLEELLATIAAHVRDMEPTIRRLASKLQRHLLARDKRTWTSDHEEGVLDPSRLTGVISNPASGGHFMQAQTSERRDTVVTLLLDNSASMRGEPMMVLSICADILSRTLERCGVKVEVLGFTTAQWRGGQSRQAWIEAGQPPQPGRLNDLCHVVYKSADTPYRRARRNLGYLMFPGLHKENIDGDALDWAYRRLLGRNERKRLLIMIADGAPLDESTLAESVTAGNVLERHLKSVIARIEGEKKVHLFAIGIGHDLGRLFQHTLTVFDVHGVAPVLIRELSALLDGVKNLAKASHRQALAPSRR